MVKIIFDEAYKIEVAEAIKGARKNIRIMMFRAQRKVGYGKQEGNIYIFWLKKKVSQGVKVRVLLDITRRPGMPFKENYIISRGLMDAGVDCRELGKNRVCHAKVVVIDERIMVVGSHNWTTNSIKRNLEVSLMVKDNYVVRRMVENFDRIFGKAERFKK